MDDPQSSRQSFLSKILPRPLLDLVSRQSRRDERLAPNGHADGSTTSALGLESEQLFIQNIFEFGHTVAREVMVPRPEVVAIDAATPLVEVVRAFESSGYSRLPVFAGQLDEIVGVLHSKDLLPVLLNPESFRIDRLIHEANFVPCNAPLHEVLRRMRAKQSHFAVVVDEHGIVEGILTLEDLLEEIVGEIQDEHDDAEEIEVRTEIDGTFLLPGSLSVRDCNRRLGLELPESDDYTTIAGFLMARAGKLLATGDAVVFETLSFTVESVDGRRIARVRLERQERV